MYYLAFDVGTKKIGIAGGDDDIKIAIPITVLPNDAELFFRIGQLVVQKGVGAFVVGYSVSGTTTENAIQKYITAFSKTLDKEFGLPVYLVNEYGTTFVAKQINRSFVGSRLDTARQLSQKGKLYDANAAAVILERFFAGIGK